MVTSGVAGAGVSATGVSVTGAQAKETAITVRTASRDFVFFIVVGDRELK